jgi:hypothetical protein
MSSAEPSLGAPRAAATDPDAKVAPSTPVAAIASKTSSTVVPASKNPSSPKRTGTSTAPKSPSTPARIGDSSSIVLRRS